MRAIAVFALAMLVPICADAQTFEINQPYDSLAECAYDGYRNQIGFFHRTDPNQVRMTPRTATHRVDLEYTMGGTGFTIPIWRAQFTPTSKRSTRVAIQILKGSDDYAIEMQKMLSACDR